MKISYLMWGWGNTGGPIVLYNFMDNLVDRGHEVYAIFPNESIKWKPGIWKELIKKKQKKTLKTKLFTFLSNNIFRYLNIENKLTEIIKLYVLRRNIKGLIKNWEESDITISTYCFTTFAGFYLSDRTVPLYHMQGYEELFFKDRTNRLIAKISYYLPLIKISNSKWLQNIIQKEFGLKSNLLNPGIDLEIFKPYKNINEKYVEKKNWTIISYVDEKQELKGFEDATKAIKLAKKYLDKKGIMLNWKIFGYSKPTNKYEIKFDYVGKVFDEDLAKMYSDADLVLFTSWFESFPLPPIEAMACGSLIITTRYGTEDYVHDKKNGLVCLPRKIDEISEKIIFAIENPKKCLEMVEKGLITAEDYDWNKKTLILEKILEESLTSYSPEKSKMISDIVKGNYHEQIIDLLQVNE